MPIKKEIKLYKRYILTVCLTVTLALSSTFLGINIRTRQLIQEENFIQARALLNSVVVAFKWNASYDGVYVKKTAGVHSNKFLENPDIKDTAGNIYTIRNPDIMTQEISVLAEQDGLFRFHITSLKPLNPVNSPDAFEKEALKSFEQGTKEFAITDFIRGRRFFRFIAPLHVEKPCLGCHKQQEYRLGDVLGGISVSFDVENTREKLTQNLIMIVIFGILAILSLVGLIYYFTKRFINKIVLARQEIERLATIDGLTGLYNRRYGMGRFEEEVARSLRVGRPLSCLMVDIDHFKLVNDRFGHLVGDEVLKTTAACITETLRQYDILYRFGGEEFMLVLPETELPNAEKIAERIRLMIKERTATGIPITVSVGITTVKDGDADPNDIINRVDEALYHAKNAGRDRTAVR